jgi:hypothetical protein
MTNALLIYGENICAFPHILGSPSSLMTLHPIPSEFPYTVLGNFCFHQYGVGKVANSGYVLPKCHKPLVTRQYIGAGTDNHLSPMYWRCKHIRNLRNPNFVAVCSHVIAYWCNWQYSANILVLYKARKKRMC